MTKSPLITHCSWGKIIVEDFGEFKDVILLPGEAKPWLWQEPYKNHSTANSVSLVHSLIETGAKTIFLTYGVDGVLKLPSETLREIEKLGLNFHIDRTPIIVEEYNRMASTRGKVAAAIHSTC